MELSSFGVLVESGESLPDKTSMRVAGGGTGGQHLSIGGRMNCRLPVAYVTSRLSRIRGEIGDLSIDEQIDDFNFWPGELSVERPSPTSRSYSTIASDVSWLERGMGRNGTAS